MDRAKTRIRPLAASLVLAIVAAGANGMPDAPDPGVDDNRGAFRWSVPIELPPGPGGLTPQLALHYSSADGDGPFGVGWRLDPGEVRCSARFGAPDLSDCPSYELDGELLNHDPASDRHPTFVESFRRIVHQTQGGDHWEVTETDGTLRRYGVDENSRIRGPGGQVFRWLLSEIENPFGQRIRFRYDGDPGGGGPEDPPALGATYLRRVAYGPNEERVVRVEYEARPDPLLDFFGGVERVLDWRALEIRVESHGALHSRVRLGYDLADLGEASSLASSGRSRLSWVQRFGRDCTAADPLASCTGLPARRFRYTDANELTGPAWSAGSWDGPRFEAPSWGAPYYARRALRIGDVDGDGRPDLVEAADGADLEPGHEPTLTLSGPDAGSSNYEDSLGALRVWLPRVHVELPPGDSPSGVCDASLEWVERRVAFGLPQLWAQELRTLQVPYLFTSHDNAWQPADDPTVELSPSFHLADLDGDRRDDLVMSVRLGAIHRTHDCSGTPLANPEPIVFADASSAQEIRIAFRNTGDGWTRDDGLAAGLPLFGIVTMESKAALWDVWGWYADPPTDCPGFFNPHFEFFAPLVQNPNAVYPCVGHADLAPHFVDLDGDGRRDLMIAEPLHPERPAVIKGIGAADPAVSPAPSRAFLSRADGSWQRAPEFDLPFHHARIQHQGAGSLRQGTNPGGVTSDAGVRFGDLNRDGLPDVLWTHDLQWTSQGEPSAARGALLNRGRGDGTPFSAWCPSRTLWHADGSLALAPCSPESEQEARRYEVPAEASFAWVQTSAPYTGQDAGLVLADLDGDGWLDLGRSADFLRGVEATAWRHDRSAAGSVWVERPELAPPLELGMVASDGQPFSLVPSGTRVADWDGDGTVDFFGIRPDQQDWEGEHYASNHRLGDRLREIRNGHGGRIEIEYDTAARLRDDALEAEALDDALARGEAVDPEGPARVGSGAEALVARLRIEGPAHEPAEITYRYAHPRWCRDHRTQQGFRIVERREADGARRARHFYQQHGRAGRVSLETVHDADGDPLWSRESLWELVDPASVTGAFAGSALGRPIRETTRHEYGGAPGESVGATRVEERFYDDVHGYDFVGRVLETRPSGDLERLRTPRAPDLGRWILGLVAEVSEREGEGGELLRRTTFTHTPEGRVESRTRHYLEPVGAWTQARSDFRYDVHGNLASRSDPLGRVTHYCVDGNPEGLGWCPSPAGQTSASVRVGTRDPLGRVTRVLPDAVFGNALETASDYTDVPGRRFELDAFGRVESEFVVPESGSEVQLRRFVHADHAEPRHREELRFPADGAMPIRRVEIDDGFGGVWKTVRDAGPASAGARHAGRASSIDAAARSVRESYDTACGTDPLCDALDGRTEPLAVVTITDALGRVRRIESPDGVELRDYRRGELAVPQGLAAPAAATLDFVLHKNAKGDLEGRWYDGDRLLATDECHDPPQPELESLDGVSCGAPERTLYGRRDGRLEVVYDAAAVAASDWNDPRHRLRYHYDGLDRVVRIDDPDGGTSTREYDPAGNVVVTENARGQQRRRSYDALDRLRSLVPPSPEARVDVVYRADELQPRREWTRDYSLRFDYDRFGRLARETRDAGGERLFTDLAYDRLGRRTKLWHPSWKRIFWEYEGAFLKRLCADFGCARPRSIPLIEGVEYDALGRRERLVLPVGERHFTYDARQRLASDHFLGAAYTLRHDVLDRDALGNPLEVSVTSSEPDLAALALLYDYDERNRLVSVSGLGAPRAYAYDALGNLTQHEGATHSFDHPEKPHALTRRVDAQGAATDYAYDASGNRILESDAEGDLHYAFDSAERLICVGSAPGSCDRLRVVYDLQGKRVLERSGATTRLHAGDDFEYTLHPPDERLPEARIEIRAFGERVARRRVGNADLRLGKAQGFAALPVGSGPGIAGLLAACAGAAWGLAGASRRRLPAAVRVALAGVLAAVLLLPPVSVSGGGGGSDPALTRWVISDALGSGSALVDEQGERVRHTHFAPFGGVALEAGDASASGPRHFAGHAEQADIGRIWMQARWMDPITGSFLSVDPQIVPSDPQSHTGYAYARNNPIANSDPTGLASCPSCGATSMLLGMSDFQAGTIQRPDTPREIARADEAGVAASAEDPNDGGPAGAEPIRERSDPDAPRLNAREAYTSPRGTTITTTRGGTPAQREHIENEVERVLETERGREMVEAVERRGRPVEIRINDSGALQADSRTGKWIRIDPDAHPRIRTTEGRVPASTARILGHEFGHAIFGTRDTGPGRMDNVIQNENPIVRELGEPARTHY